MTFTRANGLAGFLYLNLQAFKTYL